MIKKCPECGEKLSEADLFCFECGYEFPEQVKLTVEKTVTMETVPATTAGASEGGESPYDTSCVVGTQTGGSDCTDFLVEFNQGSSIFITGSTSSFQFRVTPLSDEALEAEEMQITLQYPDGTQSPTHQIHSFQNKRTQLALINYRATWLSEGLEQVVEFFFSFRKGDKRFQYTQQLLIDVYDNDMSPTKVFDNLTLKVDSIHFEGAKHAGDQKDQRMALIENLHQTKNSSAEMVKLIKQAESWCPLGLFLCEKMNENIEVPTAPQSQKKLTLKTVDGFLLHLYSDSIYLGRNKECDLCTRNLPALNEMYWTQDELIRRNQRISGSHCTVMIDDKTVGIQDLSSTNGTFLNGQNVGQQVVNLDANQRHFLSLAPTDIKPCNFGLTIEVFGCRPHQGIPGVVSLGESVTSALVMNRIDAVRERYVLLSRGVPMNLVIPGGRANWWICRRDGAFGLTDGHKWFWLTSGAKLPLASGVEEVVAQFGQYSI